MKSLIPFSLQSGVKAINEHVFGSGLQGLEKGKMLNVYYNDSIGKRELLYDLMLAALLPREWSLEDSISGNESQHVSQTQQARGSAPSEPIQI